MSQPVHISICIPAFKNINFLRRLLDSIAIQTYTDFDVVVSDDSPDEEVQTLCASFEQIFPIHFYKNSPALGTPENWNNALRMARGGWIKLIHDDDWFSGPESLAAYAAATRKHPECSFFFSAYTNVYEGTGRKQTMFLNPVWKSALQKDAQVLIGDNVIGPPSVTLHRNGTNIYYDASMKYIVDIDFYIRYLEQGSFYAIPEPLMNVGINEAQVTKYTFGIASVHLREALQLLEKTQGLHLSNLFVFDGWWRLLRNFQIRELKDLRQSGYEGPVPELLLKMIAFQKKIPKALLKTGILSKALMAACFGWTRISGKK